MTLRASIVASLLLACLLTACGGSSTGRPPVDHPIYEYQPPEVATADEEAEDEGDDEAEDAAGEDE